MLLPKDINPINTVYYNGSVALKALKATSEKTVDFVELFQVVQKTDKITFQSYILSLDWLFLVGSIRLAPDGKIEKCF